MMKVFKIKRQNLAPVIREIAKSIKRGKVVIFPTDTVYGICCDATNRKAVEKLFKIKKRPRSKPVPLFVKDIKMAKRFACINRSQEKFLKKVWPGKVTAILKAKPEAKKIFPEGIINPENKVGLRIPRHKLVNILLKELNRPLTGTSANISGKPASTKIKEVLDQFKNQPLTTFDAKSDGGQPDLVIDTGNLKNSRPSRVIDLTGKAPKILRE